MRCTLCALILLTCRPPPHSQMSRPTPTIPEKPAGQHSLKPCTPVVSGSRETLCLSLLECDCDRARSLRASAPAEWEKCIVQAIRIAWRDSSREAKVLAFLNRPIMAAIYGVQDGRS
jgi:hypothetical protein